MTEEDVFQIVKAAHELMDWRPNGSTSREQRNRWFEAAVAAVHYGHPVLNPGGGDLRWQIKNAGGGRPQSDDIVVHAPTRAYFDLISATGTDGYQWGIGRHHDTLPAAQEVYPPSRESLHLFDTLGVPTEPTPEPGPGPAPTPTPTPTPAPFPPEVTTLLQHVWARLDELAVGFTALDTRIRAIEDHQHRFQDALLTHISTERDFLHRALKQERATIVGAIGRIDANAKCVLRR